jgi:hypothetical protein
MATPWSETPEGRAHIEQCCRDSAAEAEFWLSHTTAEVRARKELAARTPGWSRWWEPVPSPVSKPWVPPPVKREVARRLGATPGATYPAACVRCGAPGEIQWNARGRVRFVGLHLDHIKPRARGGTDTAENLQPLCPACNWRKGSRWEG